MLFWLITALLTVAVTVATLRPVLTRSAVGVIGNEADLRVYKEQLSELDRDIERGILSGEEAEAARIEISRRLLAAGADHGKSKRDAETTQEGHRSSVVFYSAAALIVAGSLGLYLAKGSPGYSSQPHAARVSRAPEAAPVQELIARVEARLREMPEDGRGWDVLAPVYLKLGRNRDAITAFSNAIERLGETRDRLRGLAEAYLAETNGIVIPEVRTAFRKILEKEPDLIAPRFWLAVGLEQDGDLKGAAEAYKSLLQVAGANANLPPQLQTMIRERLVAVGAAPADVNPSQSAAASEAGKMPALPPDAAAGMSATQRSEMVEQMVKGLAERLDQNGGTRDEWQRLMRAYMVLGRRSEAVATLAKAKKQYADDATVTEELDAFARSLGLTPG